MRVWIDNTRDIVWHDGSNSYHKWTHWLRDGCRQDGSFPIVPPRDYGVWMILE